MVPLDATVTTLILLAGLFFGVLCGGTFQGWSARCYNYLPICFQGYWFEVYEMMTCNFSFLPLILFWKSTPSVITIFCNLVRRSAGRLLNGDKHITLLGNYVIGVSEPLGSRQSGSSYTRSYYKQLFSALTLLVMSFLG